MNANEILFGVVPYVVTTLAIVGTIVRWRTAEFTVSLLSSQLLESRKLYWGSVPFHWGLTLILIGHAARVFQFTVISHQDAFFYDARVRATAPGGVNEDIVLNVFRTVIS